MGGNVRGGGSARAIIFGGSKMRVAHAHTTLPCAFFVFSSLSMCCAPRTLTMLRGSQPFFPASNLPPSTLVLVVHAPNLCVVFALWPPPKHRPTITKPRLAVQDLRWDHWFGLRSRRRPERLPLCQDPHYRGEHPLCPGPPAPSLVLVHSPRLPRPPSFACALAGADRRRQNEKNANKAGENLSSRGAALARGAFLSLTSLRVDSAQPRRFSGRRSASSGSLWASSCLRLPSSSRRMIGESDTMPPLAAFEWAAAAGTL